MSVVLSKRRESRLEVWNNAELLRTALLDLSNRSFGVYSRNSIFRRRYAVLLRNGLEQEYMDNLIKEKSDRLSRFADDLIDSIVSADAIFPTRPEDLKLRRLYQDKALSLCGVIEDELQYIVTYFDVNIEVFKIQIQLLNREVDLIKRWRTSDNKLRM